MNPEGCYGECLVKRARTMSSMVIKSLVIAALVVSVFGTLILTMSGQGTLSMLTFILAVVCVVLIIVLFPRFNVEWEYVFVDGQLDFDQILGGNARKRKMRIDFDKLEVLAPSGSHHLDEFKRLNAKEYDFSSLTGCDNYTLICHDGNNIVKIFFEPDEEMVKLMKSKSPRKVFAD